MSRMFVAAIVFLFPILSIGQTIEKIDLARDNGHAKPAATVRFFSPVDDPIHFVLHLKQLAAPVTIIGTLSAVDAGGVKNHMIVSTKISGIVRAQSMDFRFSLHRPWPAGSYRVEFKANGKKLKAVEFEVR